MLEFKTERAKYHVTDNVFYLDYILDTYYDDLEAKEAIKMVHSFLDINEIKRLPIVVSANTCNPKFTFAARRILSSKEALCRYTCIAIVVNNPLQKILGSLFLAMCPINVLPIKLFDFKEEALFWVEELSLKVLEN